MELNNVDCELIWRTWNKNPNHPIFAKLQNNFYQSYNFAEYLINNNKEVPEIIIQGIAKHSTWSYWFAEYLIKSNKEVPEIIIQSIAKDSNWSYDFANYLIRNNKQVPENIKKSAKKYRDDIPELKENYFKSLYNNVIVEKLEDEIVKLKEYGYDLIDELKISPYTMLLLYNKQYNVYEISLTTGDDEFTTFDSQKSKSPTHKSNYVRVMKLLMEKVKEWLSNYGELYVGSFNKERTYKYHRIFKKMGFNITEVQYNNNELNNFPDSYDFKILK